MESYNKKSNHTLLKEIDKLKLKHEKLKHDILIKLDELKNLENELVECEDNYKIVIGILKERI